MRHTQSAAWSYDLANATATHARKMSIEHKLRCSKEASWVERSGDSDEELNVSRLPTLDKCSITLADIQRVAENMGMQFSAVYWLNFRRECTPWRRRAQQNAASAGHCGAGRRPSELCHVAPRLRTILAQHLSSSL